MSKELNKHAYYFEASQFIRKLNDAIHSAQCIKRPNIIAVNTLDKPMICEYFESITLHDKSGFCLDRYAGIRMVGSDDIERGEIIVS